MKMDSRKGREETTQKQYRDLINHKTEKQM